MESKTSQSKTSQSKILTVVIPAYNVEKYIDECLSSFVNKGEIKEVEILVIDDGATDSTVEKAKVYAQKYPSMIRIIQKENGGHGSVINRGIQEAAGKYFKVLDGDDWVDTEGFIKLVDTLKSVNSDIVASDYKCVNESNPAKSEIRRAAANDPNHYGRSWKFTEVVREPIIKIHSLTVKTKILQENNIRVDEHCFYEDAEYILYPIPYCTNVYYDNTIVYMYRLGRDGQSVDIKSMQKRRGEHEKVLKSLYAFSDENETIDSYKKRYIDKGIALSAQNQFQIYFSLGNKKKIKQEMIEFDMDMKLHHRGVYNAITKRSIWALRKTNYRIFGMGALAYKLLKS